MWTGCLSITEVTRRLTNTPSLTFTLLSNSEFAEHLACMSLDCDRKLDLPEETQKGKEHGNSIKSRLQLHRGPVFSPAQRSLLEHLDHTISVCNKEVFIKPASKGNIRRD